MRILTIAAAAILGLAAAPAQAEFSNVGDSGFMTRHTATVVAAPDAAWAELIEPSGWWSGEHSFSGDAENFTLDARAGGCFCEMLPAGPDRPTPGSVRHMEVLFTDPGTALRLSGALGPLQSEPLTAVLTVTLKPVDEGTRILFEYVVGGTMRFPVDQISPAVDRVIGEQLERLAARLGTAPAKPKAIVLPPSSALEPADDAPEAVVAEEEAEPVEASDEATFGADFLDDIAGEEGSDRADPADDEAPLDDFDTR